VHFLPYYLYKTDNRTFLFFLFIAVIIDYKLCSILCLIVCYIIIFYMIAEIERISTLST